MYSSVSRRDCDFSVFYVRSLRHCTEDTIFQLRSETLWLTPVVKRNRSGTRRSRRLHFLNTFAAFPRPNAKRSNKLMWYGMRLAISREQGG